MYGFEEALTSLFLWLGSGTVLHTPEFLQTPLLQCLPGVIMPLVLQLQKPNQKGSGVNSAVASPYKTYCFIHIHEFYGSCLPHGK